MRSRSEFPVYRDVRSNFVIDGKSKIDISSFSLKRLEDLMQ